MTSKKFKKNCNRLQKIRKKTDLALRWCCLESALRHEC